MEDGAEIDLGGTDENGKLRLWRAKEAVRQGESRLKSQGETLSGLRTRATSVLGWTVTGLLALAAAIVTGSYVVAGLSVAVAMAFSSGFCLLALWPQSFANPAWSPLWILDHPLTSELEMLEAMAQGADNLAENDEIKLLKISTQLALAYRALVAAPIVGAVALLITSSLSDQSSLSRLWSAEPAAVVAARQAALQQASQQALERAPVRTCLKHDREQRSYGWWWETEPEAVAVLSQVVPVGVEQKDVAFGNKSTIKTVPGNPAHPLSHHGQRHVVRRVNHVH